MRPVNCAIFMERITTNSLLNKIHGVQRPALSVFFGVGRGTTSARVTLVPLAAIGTPLVTVPSTTGFGWFVSWISSVVILDQQPLLMCS